MALNIIGFARLTKQVRHLEFIYYYYRKASLNICYNLRTQYREKLRVKQEYYGFYPFWF